MDILKVFNYLIKILIVNYKYSVFKYYFMDIDILFYVGLLALIVGSVTDLKRREVPDWINFGLVFFGVMFSLIISLNYLNFIPILESLIGLGVAFILASFMFYSGQWGGGDAKMLMGLGALFGVNYFSGSLSSDTFLNFSFNILIAGAIYGIFWSIFLAFKHRDEFVKKVKLLSKKKTFTMMRKTSLIVSFLLVIFGFLVPDLLVSFVGLAILILLTYYLWIYVKAVEEACMIKDVNPSVLTEGDWIAKSIVVGGKIFLKKNKKISRLDIKKIVDYQKNIDPIIKIKRNNFFIPSIASKNLSMLKKGDIILKSNKIIKTLKIKVNTKLSEEDIQSINIYLRKKSLHSVKVKRKVLFFNKELSVNFSEIQEKDVLQENLLSESYLVSGPEDLGIEMFQITELKKLYKENKIKKITI